jgi:hypothetical protein
MDCLCFEGRNTLQLDHGKNSLVRTWQQYQNIKLVICELLWKIEILYVYMCAELHADEIGQNFSESRKVANPGPLEIGLLS